MKTKLVVILCVLALGWGGPTPALANSENNAAAMFADVVIARPACLAATVIGTAFFIVSLPISLTSKSVHRAADALVTTPAKATFTRPLGDLDSLKE